LDRDVVLGKACDGERDAVGVLAGPLDVIGRIGRACVEARDLVEHREQPVESDGGTIEGSKIERTHGISSLSDMRWVRRNGRTLWVRADRMAPRMLDLGMGTRVRKGFRHGFHGNPSARFVQDNKRLTRDRAGSTVPARGSTASIRPALSRGGSLL